MRYGFFVTSFSKRRLSNDPHAVKAAADKRVERETQNILKFTRKELKRVFLKDFPGAKLGKLASDKRVQRCQNEVWLLEVSRISFSVPFAYAGTNFTVSGTLERWNGACGAGRVGFECRLFQGPVVGARVLIRMIYDRYQPSRPSKVSPEYHWGRYNNKINHSSYLGYIAQAVDDVRTLQQDETDAWAEEERRQATSASMSQSVADGTRLRTSELAS